MRTKSMKALVPFKPCPRCHGSGEVPCDGNELVRKEQREWAYTYNQKPVVFQMYDGTVVAGLAIAQLQPGGYHKLKVYVKVSDPPNTWGYAYKNIGGGMIEGLYQVGTRHLFEFDEINGKAFWPVTCRYEDRDKLQLLESWPDWMSLEVVKLLEIPN